MNAAHALVVDDSGRIRKDVADRLDSLGHSYELARSQSEAQKFIAGSARFYDYILLDVEIPSTFQGPPRQQNGKNLLKKIRKKAGYECTPVIVITGYGTDSPHLAVEMLKLGATDFINKPFDSGPDSLERKIEEAIGEREARNGKPSEAKPFQGGKLVFYPTRILLVIGPIEIKVWGDRSGAVIRRILDLLKAKCEADDKQPYKGEFIADKLNLPRGEEHVRDAVRGFRDLYKNRLYKKGIIAGKNDIIVNIDKGYEFRDWIELCDAAPSALKDGVELSDRIT